MKKILFLTTLALVLGGVTATHAQQQILLSDGWTLQQSDSDEVYKATVPSTVMGVLTANGLYKDLLDGTNYKNADRTPFDSSWWYRTEFKLPKLAKDRKVSLLFEGISYRANVWLNGHLVAPKEELFGVFCRWEFDITAFAREHNKLEVEVFRAQSGEPNIGFVDWNPRPLDESMGIFRPVEVRISGPVAVRNTWVRTGLDTETLKSADLTVESDVTNHSRKTVKGTFKGKIGVIEFAKEMTLSAGEHKHVKITPAEVAALHIDNPRIWWSVGLGNPELYDLEVEFVADKQVSDAEKVTFGIRTIDTYFTPEGHRGYVLNGKKVLIKGAGWADDIFLRDTPASNELQVQYVKDMNLNTIRFENIWGTSQNIYDLCDRYGLLALVGWSCQWEWEGYLGTPEDEFMSIRTPEDIVLVTRYMHDQVLWLRNHPSIIAWYGGSDKLARPELERNYMAMLPSIDNRPYIGSAKKMTSEVTGPSGMKMYGPYEYIGPNYWFIDTRNGGAYGFNTETGPGAQLPVLESIRKFIPENELWPMGPSWDYHCTTSGSSMNSLKRMTEVINAKYGEAKDLNDYLRKADLVAYESTKSMFEAFRANKPATTGLIQWMLNSAWPSMYWQLYDFYGVPTASYYAVKKANTPHQLVYNYKDNGIYLVNELGEYAEGLKATIKTFDLHSILLHEQQLTISSPANSSKEIAGIDPTAAKNIFVQLTLHNKEGKQIAENFYALSATHDEYNWARSGWETTPISVYADFADLGNLPTATLTINTTSEGKTLKVEVTNTSDVIAFFTTLKLKTADGEMITPAFWSDNYLNILPGETRTVECCVADPTQATLEVSGWNIN